MVVGKKCSLEYGHLVDHEAHSYLLLDVSKKYEKSAGLSSGK